MRPDFIPREVFRQYLKGSTLNKFLRVGGIQPSSYILRCERDERPLPSKKLNGSRVYRLLDLVARARADCLPITPPESKRVDEAREREKFHAEFGRLQLQSLWANIPSSNVATEPALESTKETPKSKATNSPYQPMRDEKSAVYSVDGLTVDVTDLLNTDFVILDVVSDALVKLSIHLGKASGDARALHLTRVISRVMDIHSERVIALHARLADAEDRTAPEPAANVKPEIAEQCNRLNRLRDRAEVNDYVALHTGGQDNFSAMTLTDLREIIPSDKWQELQIRLRALHMLTPGNVTKAARWVARGLDVRHAATKIQVDSEIYAAENRTKR